MARRVCVIACRDRPRVSRARTRRLRHGLAAFLLSSFLWALPGRAADVSVSVFGLFAPTELRLQAANSRILHITAERREASLEGGQPAVCRAANARVVCEVGGLRLESGFIEVTGAGSPAGFLLAVPGKIERRFQGPLRLTAIGSTLRAAVLMDRETAVSSIVAAESPPGAALEALKAQAVTSRSYLLAGSRHGDFDFCDTTHCQYLRAPQAQDHPARLAVAATEGMVLTHEGEIVRALYSRSCGGTTRTLREAGLVAEGYPYYGVPCESCRRTPEKWRSTFEREAVEALIERPTEALRLELARQAGWSSLPSTQFHSESNGDSVTLHGRGIGHGIGLCQQGAASMGADGADFGAILRHYFPNTRLSSDRGVPGSHRHRDFPHVHAGDRHNRRF